MVKYKRKKDKYKVLVKNVRANRDYTHKIKVKKFPVDHVYLKLFLVQALKIEWNSSGKKIEKVKLIDFDDVDIKKIKKKVEIQLEDIKD